MFNKCAALNCTSGCASNEKEQITKFYFLLKNVDLKRQWIRFVNRRDWPAKKHLVLCELHFEEKYLQRGEKYYSGRPTVYPQNLLSNPSPLPTQQTTSSLPRKRSFPDELSTFQQRDVIRTFQDLNESIAPAGFQFK